MWSFPEQVDLTDQDVKLLWPKTLGSSPAYHDGEGALCHRGLVEQSKGPPAHPVPVQPQRSTPSPELGRKCVCLCCSKKGGSESYRVVALHPCWSASWLVSWRLLLRPCTHGSLSTRVFSVLVLLPWTQNPLPDHAPHRNNVSNSRKPLQNRKAQLQSTCSAAGGVATCAGTRRLLGHLAAAAENGNNLPWVIKKKQKLDCYFREGKSCMRRPQPCAPRGAMPLLGLASDSHIIPQKENMQEPHVDNVLLPRSHQKGTYPCGGPDNMPAGNEKAVYKQKKLWCFVLFCK